MLSMVFIIDIDSYIIIEMLVIDFLVWYLECDIKCYVLCNCLYYFSMLEFNWL